MERWQKLCDRLYHLGYLGEELESINSSTSKQDWIYREIAREAAVVADLANAYADESERAREYYERGARRIRPRAGDEQ